MTSRLSIAIASACGRTMFSHELPSLFGRVQTFIQDGFQSHLLVLEPLSSVRPSLFFVAVPVPLNRDRPSVLAVLRQVVPTLHRTRPRHPRDEPSSVDRRPPARSGRRMLGGPLGIARTESCVSSAWGRLTRSGTYTSGGWQLFSRFYSSKACAHRLTPLRTAPRMRFQSSRSSGIRRRGPIADPLVGPLSCRPGTICPPRELTRSAAVTNNAMGIRAWQTWMHSSARWCFPPVNLSSGRRGRPIGWGHRNSPNSSRKGVFSFPRSYWSCDFGPPLSCRGSPAELLALEAGSGCPRAPVPDA